MQAPDIETAIPKRRYHIGEFAAVVLGEVSSKDGNAYHYILALVPDGESEPVLYITAEQVRLENEGEATAIRVIAGADERVLGPDERWRDLDAFCEDALAMVQQVMGLDGHEPMRLL